VRLSPEPVAVVGTGDPVAVAELFWREQLPKARAQDAAIVASAMKKNPKEAIATHAHPVGLGGTAYFFVHGEGRVVARDSGSVRIALGENADAPVIELQTGLIFGNVVRDGTGMLDLNRFPSLQDFNALSAELNKRVESQVLPVLRDRAQVGARVSFTGCAEAVEPNPGRPVLSIIPVHAEMR
jgi:predicted lipoprotein